MSDPLIREIDNYVILEPGQTERFLTSDETLIWLEKWLKKIQTLPKDLQEPSAHQKETEAQASRLSEGRYSGRRKKV